MDKKRKPLNLFNLFGISLFKTVYASNPCTTSDTSGNTPGPCSKKNPCGDYSPPTSCAPSTPPSSCPGSCSDSKPATATVCIPPPVKCPPKDPPAPKCPPKDPPPPKCPPKDPPPPRCPPKDPPAPKCPPKDPPKCPPKAPPKCPPAPKCPPSPCPPKNDCASKKSVCDLGKSGAGVTGCRTQQETGSSDLGLLRHLHNAARLRIPHCFEGAQVTLKSTPSDWIFGHTFSFSSVSPGGYKLMLSYMDPGKPIGLPYFLMEMAPGGQTSCEMRVAPTDSTRVSAMAQIADGELYSFESIFDTYFKSSSASIIAVNREYIALHFLQKMTNRLDLGTEVVAKTESPELISASAALRWAYYKNTTSFTLGNRGLDLCYSRAISDFVTVAALLEVGFASRQAVGTVAYEWSTDTWTVKGSADSDGLVGATLQHNIKGKRTDIKICVSALLNHPNNKFRLGFGFTATLKDSASASSGSSGLVNNDCFEKRKLNTF